MIKFLDSDISDEGIKKSLARISKGNKLQYMEANVLEIYKTHQNLIFSGYTDFQKVDILSQEKISHSSCFFQLET